MLILIKVAQQQRHEISNQTSGALILPFLDGVMCRYQVRDKPQRGTKTCFPGTSVLLKVKQDAEGEEEKFGTFSPVVGLRRNIENHQTYGGPWHSLRAFKIGLTVTACVFVCVFAVCAALSCFLV